MDQGFSPVPTLDPSLSLFGCQVGLAHQTTASAPFPSDQIPAKLNGWLPSVCHPGYSSDQQHCFPHLRHFKKAQELTLPPEDAEDICNSPDGLFGAYFQSVPEQLQIFHNELERVGRHGALFWPGTYSSHTTSPGLDRQVQQHQHAPGPAFHRRHGGCWGNVCKMLTVLE
ncbi:hypothetical protein ILYODFUR_028448 [Ilyodon furcidens]|uniref:Uncharacterized protein n=1 Tax=Ilyodon furcidens TaxID=33524 RepID=A0ABV0U971_9TELE